MAIQQKGQQPQQNQSQNAGQKPQSGQQNMGQPAVKNSGINNPGFKQPAAGQDAQVNQNKSAVKPAPTDREQL